VNPSKPGPWLEPAEGELAHETRRVIVEIPIGFSDMQTQAPDAALQWRLTTRRIFQSYFSRGYRAIDFFLSREARRGHYLLAQIDGSGGR
jgi:predicted GNAT superfamily acetyltransferase